MAITNQQLAEYIGQHILDGAWRQKLLKAVGELQEVEREFAIARGQFRLVGTIHIPKTTAQTLGQTLQETTGALWESAHLLSSIAMTSSDNRSSSEFRRLSASGDPVTAAAMPELASAIDDVAVVLTDLRTVLHYVCIMCRPHYIKSQTLLEYLEQPWRHLRNGVRNLQQLVQLCENADKSGGLTYPAVETQINCTACGMSNDARFSFCSTCGAALYKPTSTVLPALSKQDFESECLTQDEQSQLLRLFQELPNINDYATRNELLMGLPNALRMCIPHSHVPRTHLCNIITTISSASWTHLHDGSWPIITVVENALDMVRGSHHANDLQTVLDKLKARAAERPIVQ